MPDKPREFRDFQQLMPALQRMAPKGVPVERMRQSENVEDRRGESPAALRDFRRRWGLDEMETLNRQVSKPPKLTPSMAQGMAKEAGYYEVEGQSFPDLRPGAYKGGK